MQILLIVRSIAFAVASTVVCLIAALAAFSGVIMSVGLAVDFVENRTLWSKAPRSGDSAPVLPLGALVSIASAPSPEAKLLATE